MVRALRVEYPGAWHHVMHRGASRRLVYLCDEDRQCWLRLVAEISDRYSIEVGAYVLMDNHWHLLVHTLRPELSRAMQRLNGLYTQRFNKRHGFDGALFRGRFHSVLIESDTYLGRVAAYVHRNPLDAGMVSGLGEYKWSSLPAFLGDVPAPSWLSSRWQGVTGIATREAVIETTARNDRELVEFYGRSPVAPILGGSSFVGSRLDTAVLSTETKGHGESSFVRPLPETIDARVAQAFGIEVEDLLIPRRGVSNDPRLVAVGLSEELSGLSHGQLAEHYSYASPKSVASAAVRYRARLSENSQVAAIAQALRATWR